ncbi:hypothetical protein [Niveibacterium sp.]|uniref:hypothetical protein n=1 Tax=Niveibacterium sp. TaxID=2017444 RepID=UPI0035AD9E3B
MLREAWQAFEAWLADHSWAQLILRLLLAALIAWPLVRWQGLVGLVLALVPMAALIAVPLTLSGFDLLRWLRKGHLKRWNGRWYAFHGIQIRLFELPDHTWLCADDVFRALGEPVDGVVHERFRNQFGALGYREPPGETLVCFSEAALRRYLSLRSDARSREFARWLERDVLFAHEKRRREAPFS